MRSVIWFRNTHEQRNDLLRFGFMRLHRQGRLTYVEMPLGACVGFGFDEAVATHEHRHTSVLLIRDGSQETRCLIDSEDSFFWMSPLIRNVDVYFCSGYNADVFEHRRMFEPYAWQSDQEVQFYRDRVETLVAEFGSHFRKVRRFVPIGPSMATNTPTPWLVQKTRNIRHKIASMVSGEMYWKNDLLNFETRYSELTALREGRLNYDVVLLDTLWGWPRHRLALHLELQRLSSRYRIHSALNWSDPVPFDGSVERPLDRSLFPLATNPVHDYERMLSESRLAVFATGFHWGWRSIMSLALMVGLPVYMDRAVLEPWFDFDEFVVFWNDEAGWNDLERHLEAMTPDEWRRAKLHNQRRYDEVMSPEAVARYVLEAALG